jgi:heavy metal translocating P-type ATPase
VVEPCTLCGLPARSPVGRRVADEEKVFCCSGCAQVYELALESGVIDQVLGTPAARSGPRPPLAGPRETAYFSLKGMWCAGCAVAAEGLLRRQPGVRSVDVSFAAERGRMTYDPSRVDPKRLLARLSVLGYRAALLSDRKEAAFERRVEGILLQLIVAVAFGMQVMMIYLAMLYPRYAAGDYSAPDTRNLQYVALGLAVPVLLVGGLSFLRGAVRALLARTATMDTLVALGTVSAFGYSVYVTITGSGAAYFDSVVMITTFVTLGRYLESVGGSRARRDINALLTLQPELCWIRQEGNWAKAEAGALVRGDHVLIKQGERVPADSVVLEGAAVVDESLLTGESAPLPKAPGDPLSGGTLVAEGSLVARVSEPVAESRLSRISRLIEQTLATKPPIQRIADRASAYFAFGIVAIAAVTLIARLSFGQPLPTALVATIAVLVVACPCALGLATPLALTVALGLTARTGVVVRNPAALEVAAIIKRAVFDKTGTVTRGSMTVEHVRVLDSARTVATAAEDLLCVAAAVEQFSEHPVARAIVSACAGPLPGVTDFEVRRGQGSSARVPALGNERVMVGSAAYLGLDLGFAGTDAGSSEGAASQAAQAAAYTSRGSTVVWVGCQGSAKGFIALRDEPNPSAGAALAELRDLGVATTILSGDDPRTVETISAEIGVPEWAGGLTPEDKAGRILSWQESGERTLMVGDGVNDAPALAQAELAIAMAAGTDLAGETADVILTGNDLRAVPWFLRLSTRTRRVIRENLAWAFAYNLVAIPLAVTGLVSPIIASGAMACSSVLVVANSLRLRRLAPGGPPVAVTRRPPSLGDPRGASGPV